MKPIRRFVYSLGLALAVVISSAASGAERETSARGRVLRPICTADAWCWEHPRLTRAEFVAISGSSASDVWMVAVSGGAALLRWDGTGWTATGATVSPVVAEVPAIVPRAGGVGPGAPTQTPALVASVRAIWAAGPGNAWAVGYAGAILRWDGRAWAGVASPTRSNLQNVWGRRADDAWAVGDRGAVLHWDGKAWNAVSTGTTDTIVGAWASEPGEAWLIGGRTLLRWDGERVRDAPGAPPEVVLVGGRRRGEAWALTAQPAWWRWDGQRWSRADAAPDASRIGTAATIQGYAWAGAVDAIWRAGPSSTIQRLERRGWTTVARPPIATPVGAADANALWGSRPDDVWAAGAKGALWHWDGRAWSAIAGTERFLWSVFAIGPDEIWAAGAGISRREGNGGWRDMPGPPGEERIHTMFGAAPNDVWACGAGIWRWDGKAWTALDPGFPCAALWGVGQDTWAVGADMMALRSDGEWNVWERPGNFQAVWSPRRDEVWMAGERPGGRGWIVRVSGQRETSWPERDGYTIDPYHGGQDDGLPRQFSRPFRAIWGSSARDVYAGGDENGLVHWDGTRWRQGAGFGGSPVSIWGRGRDDVWVATSGLGVQHWDGRAWSEVGSSIIGVRQITGTAARVWVATRDGAILSRPRDVEPR